MPDSSGQVVFGPGEEISPAALHKVLPEGTRLVAGRLIATSVVRFRPITKPAPPSKPPIRVYTDDDFR